MTLAVDITDGRGLNNEVMSYCQRRVMLYLLLITQEKAFIQLYITNSMERFNFKSGHAMQVAKLIKEDWLKCYSKNFGSK